MPEPAVVIEVLIHGFPQSLMANSGMVPFTILQGCFICNASQLSSMYD